MQHLKLLSHQLLLRHPRLAPRRRLLPKLLPREATLLAATRPAATPLETPTRQRQAPPSQAAHQEVMPLQTPTRPSQTRLQQTALPEATPQEAQTRLRRTPLLLPLLRLLKPQPRNRPLKLAKPNQRVRLMAWHPPHLSRPSKAMPLLSRPPLPSSALLSLVSPLRCLCERYESPNRPGRCRRIEK